MPFVQPFVLPPNPLLPILLKITEFSFCLALCDIRLTSRIDLAKAGDESGYQSSADV